MANLNLINTPIILAILDGWGISDKTKYNAIHLANTPCFDKLTRQYPNSKLSAHGEFVGLPKGKMGNSEVGHLTIGSGRAILQSLPRINKMINEGELESKFNNIDFTTINLIGIISDGGVHGDIKHILYLAKLFASKGIKTYIHAILDGRDVAPKSTKKYLTEIQKNQNDNIILASISGRFYAMDRDNNLERTEEYLEALMQPHNYISDPIAYINESYEQDISDEFIKPVTLEGFDGIKDNDAIFVTNFRSDRIRQLLFKIQDHQKIYCFGSHHQDLENKVINLLPKIEVKETLPQILSDNKFTQLHIAESEKYAHVTFFLNGGKEEIYEGEERIIIPSPKVSTYDQSPKMSAKLVTDNLIRNINDFDVIIVNYANADMVGHSGNLEATIEAVEEIDNCLAALYKKIQEIGGAMLITADHGNAEEMFDEQNQQALTSHTLNPVPCILVNEKLKHIKLKDGSLADIAPTILSLLDIPIASCYDGKNLTEKD